MLETIKKGTSLWLGRKKYFLYRKIMGGTHCCRKTHLNDLMLLCELAEAGEVTNKYVGNPPVLYIDFLWDHTAFSLISACQGLWA